MSPNRIHILRQAIAGFILFVGLFCMAISSKADYLGGWSYTSDGTNVTITGYTGTCVNIVVPIMIDNLPVISIGTSAFISSPLTNITIPYTVTSIGHLAFMGCASLANITIGNGVTSIRRLQWMDSCNMPIRVMQGRRMPFIGSAWCRSRLELQSILLGFLDGFSISKHVFWCKIQETKIKQLT